MWTKFWDMHSGGRKKEDWNLIFIEAPYDEALSVFYAKFGHNPHRVTCTCCGPDYSIDEYETLEEAMEFHKDEIAEGYKTHHIIRADEIVLEERVMTVPRQGYVWVD